MELVLTSPTVLRLPASWQTGKIRQELEERFGYSDLRTVHEWRKWKQIQRQVENGCRHWFVERYGKDDLDAKVALLDAQKTKTVLFEHPEDGMWTYSGFAEQLSKDYGIPIVIAFPYVPVREAGCIIPWAKTPFSPRPYQQQASELLLEHRQAGVELATGLGKTLLIAMLLKHFGLPSLVSCPSLNIGEQTYNFLLECFGRSRVGRFFDGHKEADKLFTVSVSKSLTMAVGGPNAAVLSKKRVLILDEAHTYPADTLASAVLGYLGDIPYRYSLSGTQLRTDGLDILLKGIVGPIVMEMSVKDGVDQNYLAKPRFYQKTVRSNRSFSSDDTIKMTRVHLHDNEAVYKDVIVTAHRAVSVMKRRVLILIEEFRQFAHLIDYGLVGAKFAHGGMDKKTKNDFPEVYHNSDPLELVKSFDRGEFPILVGTSCIGTGTDIKSVGFIIDIVGGKSEIRLRQNIGRGTRLFDGKKECIYYDYDVVDIPVLHKHAKDRAKIFDNVCGPVVYLR